MVLSATALLAGCTTTDLSFGLDSAKKPEPPTAEQQAAIVQGACPKVVLREGTAYHVVYAKGAKKTPDGRADPEKLRYQASIAQTTRQCRVQGQAVIMTVVAAGRLVTGPSGAAEQVELPIRVAAVDGETTVYSELTKFPVQIPADLSPSQFVFTKSEIVLPNGVTPLTKVFVGFDEGPYNTK